MIFAWDYRLCYRWLLWILLCYIYCGSKTSHKLACTVLCRSARRLEHRSVVSRSEQRAGRNPEKATWRLRAVIRTPEEGKSPYINRASSDSTKDIKPPRPYHALDRFPSSPKSCPFLSSLRLSLFSRCFLCSHRPQTSCAAVAAPCSEHIAFGRAWE